LKVDGIALTVSYRFLSLKPEGSKKNLSGQFIVLTLREISLLLEIWCPTVDSRTILITIFKLK
jgi:hypothetical protein